MSRHGGCIRSVPTYKSGGVIAGADIAGKAQSQGEVDETDLSERVKLETGFHVSPCGLLAVFDTIAKLMLDGYDVRITDRCRFYACVNKSRSQLEVAVQAMGRFRQAMAETPSVRRAGPDAPGEEVPGEGEAHGREAAGVPLPRGAGARPRDAGDGGGVPQVRSRVQGRQVAGLMSKTERKTKMAMKSMKDLREIAEAALATGVANKEQLQNAVPALVALQNAKRSMELRIKETKEVIEALSAACSAYAHRHPEYVFNQSFSVSPIGARLRRLRARGAGPDDDAGLPRHAAQRLDEVEARA